MIPIVHVLAKNDQGRAGNNFGPIHLFQQCVRRWTTGAAFRRKEFDENGVRIFALWLDSSGLIVRSDASSIQGRSALQKEEAAKQGGED